MPAVPSFALPSLGGVAPTITVTTQVLP
jgi:hypothetical protein